MIALVSLRLGLGIGAVFLVCFLILLAFVWWDSRREQREEERVLKRIEDQEKEAREETASRRGK